MKMKHDIERFLPAEMAGRRRSFYLFLFLLLPLLSVPVLHAQVRIAQISDTHIGEQHSPHAFDNLRRTVDMVNSRHPDAVIVSGDMGENPEAWDKAKGILKWLHAPVYYAPGNHDVHSKDLDRYRSAFGRDYYRFQVKGVTFLVIDSQLLGNYDMFEAHTPPPLPPRMEDESERMLGWLKNQGRAGDADQDPRGRDSDDDSRDDDRDRRGDRDDRSHGRGIIIGVQHIPVFRDGDFPPDTKPYWVVSDPYRSREMEILHRIGVRHMLVGHWHNFRVFNREGITWHVGAATSWLPWGGELGFVMHTITADGDVRSEFVPLGVGP
jgi:3',5'-cyclic AMP phosphodiesterase CpdA